MFTIKSGIDLGINKLVWAKEIPIGTAFHGYIFQGQGVIAIVEHLLTFKKYSH